MSLKIKRYQANESEFTRDVRNKATFDLPPSAGFVDLTQSHLVLDMKMDVTDVNGDTMLYPATFGVGGEMVGPKSMLRHARVKSRQHGMLNERRHINVIDSNMDWYKTPRDREDTESLFGGTVNTNYGCDNYRGMPDNPWLLIERPSDSNPTVTQEAIKRRAEIAIPWRHFDQFGSMSQYPAVAVGEVRYEIEFEDQFNVAHPVVKQHRVEACQDRLAVGGFIGKSGSRVKTVKTTSNFNRPPMIGDRVKVMFTEGDSLASRATTAHITNVVVNGNYYDLEFKNGATEGLATTTATESCTDIHILYDPIDFAAHTTTTAGLTTFGTSVEPLVISNFYANETVDHACPFYVGEPVRLVALVDSSIGAGLEWNLEYKDTKVEKLEISGNSLKVILEQGVDTSLNYDLANIHLSARDFHDDVGTQTLFSAKWVVEEAMLETKEIQLTPGQLESARKALENLEIPFLQERMLQKDMPSTTLHTDVVHALPGCAGLAVLSPQNLRLLSGWDQCESYRFAINGIESTNRNVIVYNTTDETLPNAGRQLHNHLLKKFFANLGLALNKYDAPVVNLSTPDDERLHSIYPLITPMVGAEQTIQLQLFATNAMAQKTLYYLFYHPKVLSLSNGRVRVV